MKISKTQWNNKFNGINIIINDSKKLIRLFEGKYKQFLIRNKGADLNSKESIIILLNSKPRSFLSTLKNLVTSFKYYNNQLTTYSSQVDPKYLALIAATKSELQGISLNDSVSKLKLAALSSSDLQSNSTQNPAKYDGKLELLRNKINSLTKSLNKNKLPMPLNILKPLLPSSLNTKSLASLGEDYLNSKKGSIIQRTIQYIEMPKLDLTLLLGPNWESRIDQTEYNNLYLSKVNKFKDIIKKYSTNNGIPVKNNKYLQLITPFKHLNAFQQNIQFKFNLADNIKIQNISPLLEYAFRAMSCLISKPVFMETPDKLTVNLFYFIVPGKAKLNPKFKSRNVPIATSLNGINIPSSENDNNDSTLFGKGKLVSSTKATKSMLPLQRLLTAINIEKLNKLCTIMSRIFQKPVEFDLIRLHLPYFDDNILVKAIGIMSKKVHVRNIIKYIFSKTIIHSRTTNNLTNKGSIIPSFLGGIKIKIGGRLMTQRVIPRLSTRVIQRGAIARGKINYVDWSRVNLKNKRGAHSITVTMSHVF